MRITIIRHGLRRARAGRAWAPRLCMSLNVGSIASRSVTELPRLGSNQRSGLIVRLTLAGMAGGPSRGTPPRRHQGALRVLRLVVMAAAIPGTDTVGLLHVRSVEVTRAPAARLETQERNAICQRRLRRRFRHFCTSDGSHRKSQPVPSAFHREHPTKLRPPSRLPRASLRSTRRPRLQRGQTSA